MMMRNWLRLSLLMVMLLAAVFPVLAQDDENADREGWAEFTSDDEKIRVSHPEDWIVQIDPVYPASVVMASSEDALQRMIETDPASESGLLPGEQFIGILTYPLSIFTEPGSPFENQEITPEALALWLTRMLTLTTDTFETETMELEDGRNVVITHFSQDVDQADGTLFLIQTDDLVHIAMLFTHVGESSDTLQALALDIFSTYAVDLTAAEIDAMLRGETVEAEATAEPGD